jgi:lipopolysaccharide biosynthesis protein
MPTDELLINPVNGAQTLWTYKPSQARLSIVGRRWIARLFRGAFPSWKTLVPASPQTRWLAYFVYLPDGQLTAGHRFTLDRLAAERASLMVICACPDGHAVLDELRARCDALYWKDMPGYDFSAYALGLSELVLWSPGADVLFMNDSIFGPFAPLEPFIQAAPWRVTGFTANATRATEENHVQSYAFVIKNLQMDVLQAAAPSMSMSWAYNDIESVILLQETRLTRMLARHFDVGAYWCSIQREKSDLCLFRPRELIEAGFPFLKRSLLGKFATRFQQLDDMKALLNSLGHPLP